MNHKNEPAVGANGPSIVSGRASLIVLDVLAVPPDRELLAVAVMLEPLHLPKQPMRSEELGSNSKLQNSKLAALPRATTTLKRTPSHRVDSRIAKHSQLISPLIGFSKDSHPPGTQLAQLLPEYFCAVY